MRSSRRGLATSRMWAWGAECLLVSGPAEVMATVSLFAATPHQKHHLEPQTGSKKGHPPQGVGAITQILKGFLRLQLGTRSHGKLCAEVPTLWAPKTSTSRSAASILGFVFLFSVFFCFLAIARSTSWTKSGPLFQSWPKSQVVFHPLCPGFHECWREGILNFNASVAILA